MAYGGIIGQDGGAINPSVLSQYGLSSGNVSDVLAMLAGSLKVEETEVPDTVFLKDFTVIPKEMDNNSYAVDVWNDGDIIVVIMYNYGVYRSSDGGKTYKKISTISGVNYASLVEYKGVLIVCPGQTGSTGYYSEDKGATWKACSGTVGAYPSAIGDYLYSANQPSGSYNTHNIITRTTDGKTWKTVQSNGSTYDGPIVKIGNVYVKICYNTRGVYTCTNSSLENSNWNFNRQFYDLESDYAKPVDFAIYNGALYIFTNYGGITKTTNGTTYTLIKQASSSTVASVCHSIVQIEDKLLFLFGNDLDGESGWIMDSSETFTPFSIGTSLTTYGRVGSYKNGELIVVSQEASNLAGATFYISKDTFKLIYALQTPTGTNITDQVAQALGSVKVETGSYEGTSTYGESNPTVLTFEGIPILLCVLAYDEPSGGLFSFTPNDGYWSAGCMLWISPANQTGVGASSSSGVVNFSVEGNKISYFASSSLTQMNGVGYLYKYTALTISGGDT